MKPGMFEITTYCTMHQVDYTFINALKDEGLINVTSDDEGEFIEEEQLHELEIYTRWHHELGINTEGIDAIRHLVKKLREMHAEMNALKNRLRLYEQGD
jgi:hypothetical protein